MKKTIQIIIATVLFACNAHASDSENIACKSAKPGFLKSVMFSKTITLENGQQKITLYERPIGDLIWEKTYARDIKAIRTKDSHIKGIREVLIHGLIYCRDGKHGSKKFFILHPLQVYTLHNGLFLKGKKLRPLLTSLNDPIFYEIL